jgi:hypothetical protein
LSKFTIINQIRIAYFQNKPTKGKQRGFWRVRQGSQFWYGGTQRGSILFWGYLSKKRLRTPELDKIISFRQFYEVLLPQHFHNRKVFFFKYFDSVTVINVSLP